MSREGREGAGYQRERGVSVLRSNRKRSDKLSHPVSLFEFMIDH